MLKIAVCDDDKNILTEVRQYVEVSIRTLEIEYKICNYTNGLVLLSEMLDNNFDIIFLDYDMPNITGYELAKEIREYNNHVKIIYITNYAEYMHLAFSVHAFDYIVKPINQEKITKTVVDVFKSMNIEKKEEFIELKFRLKDGIRSFRPEEILYFEYSTRKVCLHTNLEQIFLPRGEKISSIAKKDMMFI